MILSIFTQLVTSSQEKAKYKLIHVFGHKQKRTGNIYKLNINIYLTKTEERFFCGKEYLL